MLKIKFIARVCVISAVISCLGSGSLTAYAATENDLREVMGLMRMDSQEGQDSIKTMIAACSRNVSHNDLVRYLGEHDLTAYSTDAEDIKAWNETYDAMMSSFKSGSATKLDQLLEEVSGYNTMFKKYRDVYVLNGTDLDLLDESGIEQNFATIKALKNIAGSEKEIGKVGAEMPTFTKEELVITGINSDGSVYSSTGEYLPVYAQFSGKIHRITDDSVTISAGETILFTLSGIIPDEKLQQGQNILQGDRIGRSGSDDLVKVSMTAAGMTINPLTMYGKRASAWYSRYLSGGGEIMIDFSSVKDAPEGVNTVSASNTNSTLTVTSGKTGNTEDLKIGNTNGLGETDYTIITITEDEEEDK